MTSSNEPHEFAWQIRRRRWPPFYSTSVYAPRFRLTMTNRATELGRLSISVKVARHEGTISDIGAPSGAWVDAGGIEVEKGWAPGEEKVFPIRIDPRAITAPGAYVVEVHATEWRPNTRTLLEDLMSQMRAVQQTTPSITDEQREQMVENVASQMRSIGIDVHRPGSTTRPRRLSMMRVVDLFRVEPFSAVLNFWLVIGTLVMAAGTLALALTALFK